MTGPARPDQGTRTPVPIPVKERSPEWYAERRKGVTASEIPVLLGLSPYSSPFELFWRKKGELPEEADSPSMEWGRRLERLILDRFAENHPELLVEPGCLHRHGEREWQMATPDGLACESLDEILAVVQAKTDGSRHGWGDEGTDDIPVHYRAQVLWEMDVMAVGTAFVPVLFNGRDYREYVVEYDPADAAFMRGEAIKFLDRLDRDDPPEVDWRPATGRALKRLHSDVEDVAVEVDPIWIRLYHWAHAIEKTASDTKALAEHHLRDAMGSARVGTAGGRKVASRSKYQVREQIRKAYTADRLTITKPKETP